MHQTPADGHSIPTCSVELRSGRVADIITLTQHPLARVNESYAFCHHGGWYECEMQTHALCAGKLKPDEPLATYHYIDCAATDRSSARPCSLPLRFAAAPLNDLGSSVLCVAW